MPDREHLLLTQVTDASSGRTGPWARAAFLRELAASWPSAQGVPVDGIQKGQDLVEQWRQTFQSERDQVFDERLDQEGLDRDRLAQLLAQIEALEAAGEEWPAVDFADDWPRWVEDFIHDRHHDQKLPRVGPKKDGPEPPFFQFIGPVIRTALAKIRARLETLEQTTGAPAPLATKAFGRMVDALATRLFTIASPTLVLELNVARLRGELKGEDGPSRGRMYSEVLLRQPERRRALFAEYSMLGRMLVQTVRFWVDAMATLVESYAADRGSIASTFFDGEDPGELTDLELALSDPHRQGRTVIVVELGSERKLVYKPKSLAVDRRFQELLGWLEDKGLENPHRKTEVLDCGEYGWCEYVTAVPCQDLAGVGRFYWRQGSYLALLYALRGCDFHYENLIAAGETPVLIDLESLFHPALPIPEDEELASDSKKAAVRASTYLLESVYGIGLLPLVTRRRDGLSSVDLGGLSGRGGVGGFEAPVLIDKNLDTMRFEKQEVSLPDKRNRPTLLGVEVVPLDHLDQFMEGFEKTYALLVQHRGEFKDQLASFADLPIRFIARPTARYMGFVQQTWHPDYLRRGIDQDKLLDLLWTEVKFRPGLAPLTASEREDLRGGDVPFFHTTPSSRHVWDSSGRLYENFFDSSSLDRVLERLETLGPVDFEDQETLIKQTLLPLSYQGPTIAKAKPVETPDRFEEPGAPCYRAAVRVVAERLADKAILGEDDASWIGATASADDSWQWRVGPLGYFLYDGLSGIGLFLAYAGKLLGEPRYEELSRRVAGTLQEFLEKPYPVRVGAFGGHGGVLYTLHHMAAIWGEPEIQTRALDAVLPGLLEKAGEDEDLDLMGGVAGCAVLALRLAEDIDDDRLLDLARACGDRLVETAQEQGEGVGWVGPAASKPLAGFSHGAAGIAWALTWLGRRLDEPRYVEFADRALIFERSFFDPNQQNWNDVREMPQKQAAAPLAWCHGGTGIALGRGLMAPWQSSENRETARQEMRIGAEQTALHGFGGNHSLCHGDLGNLEMLLGLAEALDEPEWRQVALRHATRVAGEVSGGRWRCGLPRHAETPGLMLGTSGIGWGLLRIAFPGRVPSLLSLETATLHSGS